MFLHWIKCKGDVWGNLNTVNLNHPHFNNLYGVYIIWHGGPKPATVLVGRGYFREQLSALRSDRNVQFFQSLGLYVTWAVVAPTSCDSVVRWLVQRLRPKLTIDYPLAVPLSVNLPW
jgi:hypothetical protein